MIGGLLCLLFSVTPPGIWVRAQRIYVCLADDQVPTSEELLDGLRARPVAREQEAAVRVRQLDADGVGRPRLTLVGHRDLQRQIAAERDRSERVRDVPEIRLAVERRRLRGSGRQVRRQGRHRVALDLIDLAAAADDGVDAALEVRQRLGVLDVEAEVRLKARP